jgi:plastocyanin
MTTTTTTKGIYMRPSTWIVIAVLTTWATVARGQEQPTTQPVAPATQPAVMGNGVIRGRVSIEGGSLFQKPDLARVVIYLASNPALDAIGGTKPRASVGQRNKSFVPSFTIVPRGTDVEFPNWDRFDHNVFSRSAAAPAFDLDRYPYGQSKTRTFDKLGVVQIFCNIHPQMRAVVYVTPNRFFARADEDGNFEITGVPDGTYEVVAWHERCDEQRQPVTFKTDAATGSAADASTHVADLTFKLSENRDRILSATDHRKHSYGVERGLGIKRERLDLPVVTESHPALDDSQPE